MTMLSLANKGSAAACGSSDNGCKGKNSCKGKGGCSAAHAEKGKDEAKPEKK